MNTSVFSMQACAALEQKELLDELAASASMSTVQDKQQYDDDMMYGQDL